MIEKLKSRKFIVAILGGLLTVFGQAIGLTPDIIESLVQIVVFYIMGQGAVDAVAAIKKPQLTETPKPISKLTQSWD